MNTNTVGEFSLFALPGSMNVASTTFIVDAVGTAGTFDVGIYSGDGGTLYTQGTTNNIANTGLHSVTFSPSVTLGAGTYYWALIPNGTANLTFKVRSLTTGLMNESLPEQNIFQLVGESNPAISVSGLTAGTLPASFDPTINSSPSWYIFRLDNPL